MNSEQVPMHGPEHHFIVPAVLLAAYYNIKDDPEEKKRNPSITTTTPRAARVNDLNCDTLLPRHQLSIVLSYRLRLRPSP
jgi:hypothetical protein